MKKAVCWLVPWILAGLVLSACGPADAGDATPLTAFDALAHRLPATVQNAFFLDFRPDDPVSQYRVAIRRRLEQSPATQQPLADLLAQFRVEAYDLGPIIEGPAAAAAWGGATVVLLPVVDEAAAWERMIRNLGDAQSWKQTTLQGKLIYHGRFWDVGNQPTYLAWTMDEDLLYLVHSYDSRSIERLSDLLGLARGATLSSLDSWRLLQQRLPDAPLAVAFVPVAAQASRPFPAGVDVEDQPPTAVLEHHLLALGLAITPEDTGLRIDVQGVFDPDAETPRVLEALFGLPAADPAMLEHLPADSAVALSSHDAAVIWPWFAGVLGLNLSAEDPFSVTIGLDLEADLLGEEGPLRNAFAMALLPPGPDQPVIQGLPALQALLVGGAVAPAQVERLAGDLEAGNTVWATADVAGMEIRGQVGTQLSGYTLSYGLDGDTLFLSTSPEVIGQAVEDRQAGSNLVGSSAFQSILSKLPGDPFLLAYLDSQRFTTLVHANTGRNEDSNSQMIQFLELFEAMGVGLRLQSEQEGDATLGGVQGVVYFLMEE